MTDFLEALLRQEETEETRESVPFAAVPLGPSGTADMVPPRARPDAGAVGIEGPEAGFFPADPAEPRRPAPAEHGQRQAVGQEEETEGRPPLQARRATDRAGEGALPLYQRLRRLAAAVHPPKSTASTLLLPAQHSQTADWPDLSGLDRRLEREARRYDGAFRLY